MDVLSSAATGVTGEIGDVTGECGPRASDRGHATEPEVGFGAAVNGSLECEDLSTASCLVHAPSHGREGSNWCGNQLDCEQVAEFGWWDQEKWQLDDPEQEVTGDKSAGCSSRNGPRSYLTIPFESIPCFAVSIVFGMFA